MPTREGQKGQTGIGRAHAKVTGREPTTKKLPDFLCYTHVRDRMPAYYSGVRSAVCPSWRGPRERVAARDARTRQGRLAERLL